MYQLSESEFLQYEWAELRLQNLLVQHADELKEAYDGIHPTRVCFNYSLGEIYTESVNPVDYAIYLVDLKEEHKRVEQWWRVRVLAFREALALLSSEEREVYYCRSNESRTNIKKKLKEHLARIIETRPELQRKTVALDELEDIEEVDRQIDAMSMEELLEHYWDKDELG